MPGLQSLKKHLQSIRATGQLAGAMKTVSAAKYSKINLLKDSYTGYASAARELTAQFGSAFSAVLPCRNPDAPDCFVVLSSNRGLCGGYNVELISYALQEIMAHPRPYLLFTGGKMAERYFAGKGIPVARSYTIPDVPTYADIRAMAEELLNDYSEGRVASVRFIYPHFRNMLTQEPGTDVLLPFGGTVEATSDPGKRGDPTVFCLPDRETVVKAASLTCYRALLYTAVLETAAGAQAATMMAMRSAYDNAEESAALLETELNRRRQSEVTAGVIETSVDHNSFD